MAFHLGHLLARYRNLVWQVFFSFQHTKNFISCLLSYMVFLVRSLLSFSSLYNVSFFWLLLRFAIYLWFSAIWLWYASVVCVSIFAHICSCRFIMLRVHWAVVSSWKICGHISSNIFLSFPYGSIITLTLDYIETFLLMQRSDQKLRNTQKQKLRDKKNKGSPEIGFLT